jgi:hypothetical protein
MIGLIEKKLKITEIFIFWQICSEIRDASFLNKVMPKTTTQ